MFRFLLRISLFAIISGWRWPKRLGPKNVSLLSKVAYHYNFCARMAHQLVLPNYRVSSPCNYPTRKCHGCEGITTPILPAHEIPPLRAPALFCLKTKTVECKLLFCWLGSFSNFFSTIFPPFLKFAHLRSNRSSCFRCHRGGAGNRVLTSRISSHMFAHARSQPKLTSRKLRLFRPA